MLFASSWHLIIMWKSWLLWLLFAFSMYPVVFFTKTISMGYPIPHASHTNAQKKISVNAGCFLLESYLYKKQLSMEYRYHSSCVPVLMHKTWFVWDVVPILHIYCMWRMRLAFRSNIVFHNDKLPTAIVECYSDMPNILKLNTR